MPEIPVRIPVGTFELEGRMEGEDRERVVVLCHPHPLYGGSMDNNVVSVLRGAFYQVGFGTLRFNFRGVGGSGGTYGEGDGEVEDLLGVVGYLEKTGMKSLHLAGYSFGAWIALRAVNRGLDAASMVLVSPPLDFLDFVNLALPEKPCLLTLGSRDSFCAEMSLREWLATQGNASALTQVQILQNCDHFYWGHEKTLLSLVTAFIKEEKWRMNG